MISDYVPILGDQYSPVGGNWIEWIDAKLRSVFRSPVFEGEMNSPEDSETGKCLSTPFVGHLQIKLYTKPPYITHQQFLILKQKYFWGKSYPAIADALEIPKGEVYHERDRAFESLIRIASGNPYYRVEERI